MILLANSVYPPKTKKYSNRAAMINTEPTLVIKRYALNISGGGENKEDILM